MKDSATDYVSVPISVIAINYVGWNFGKIMYACIGF